MDRHWTGIPATFAIGLDVLAPRIDIRVLRIDIKVIVPLRVVLAHAPRTDVLALLRFHGALRNNIGSSDMSMS